MPLREIGLTGVTEILPTDMVFGGPLGCFKHLPASSTCPTLRTNGTGIRALTGKAFLVALETLCAEEGRVAGFTDYFLQVFIRGLRACFAHALTALVCAALDIHAGSRF